MRGAALTARHAPAEKPLTGWQLAFAEWLAHQADKPSVAEQLAKAEELSQTTVSAARLLSIKRRTLFKEYYGKLHLDALKRARAKLDAHIDRAVDVHLKSIERVGAMLDSEFEDRQLAAARVTPSLTVPLLDRIAPKRPDGLAQTNITISLSPRQHAALTDDAVDIEVLDAEIIESDVEHDDL